MALTRIITHRGLDPSLPGFPMESSIEAFRNQLGRGYGLEFDVRRTADDQLAVIHDGTLKRATKGADEREIRAVPLAEILMTDFGGSHLASFLQVLAVIKELQHADALSAIHLKSDSQDQSTLDLILRDIASSGLDLDRFIMFDAKIETAEYLKRHMPGLHLAPSVAHPYDVERYNSAVGGTLYTLDEAVARRDLFDWVWLDEWDTADKGGGIKRFYTAETFDRVHKAGLKAALVTPELHASSPSLLGGEAHEDAKNEKTLMIRIKEIIALGPDAVCTDYPDRVYAN